MKGLTTYGKFLRKLRVDNNETLKDMASKMGVSVAYLSAIELGRREIPQTWNDTIYEIYKLDDAKFEEMLVEYSKSVNDIKISFEDLGEQERKIVTSFARKFSSFTEEQFKKIENIIDSD